MTIASKEEDKDDKDDTDCYSKERKCNSCGKPNLSWSEYEGRWKLIDSTGRVHNCSHATYRLPLDEDTVL